MPARTRWSWAVVLLLVATGWGVARLFDVSTRGGEAFPAHSTLRSDPMGSKALHDALAAMPGYRVERSFRPLERFRPPKAAVIFLLSAAANQSILADCRQWALAGSRVIVVLQPRPRTPETGHRKNTPLEDEWKIAFLPSRADRRWTVFVPQDESWRVLRQVGGEATVVEKRLGGNGSIVLAGEAVMLSNEGLYKARDPQLLLGLLDGRREVIFEESHLGVVQSGSVGQLLRRYRLGGAALVLALLAALFFWRASTSFLPPPLDTGKMAAPTPGEDALTGLVRGAIAPPALVPSALSLWTRGQRAMTNWSASRRERVTLALTDAGGANPLDTWRRAHEILKRNST